MNTGGGKMTLTQLSTFIAIMETGSFTTAADTLGYAQSTITMQIKQLEEELQCQLFDRLGKTVILTQEGERLVSYAQKILQLEREIQLEVPRSLEPVGILKLGVSESLCYREIPEILVAFQKKCPKVEVQLRFIDHLTFPELIKKGALDLVYTLNPKLDYPELSLLYQREESLGFYVSPMHALLSKKEVSEQDLQGESLLLTGVNCSFRKMLLHAFEEKNIEPNITLSTSRKEILKRFAMENLGIAFIPDLTASEEIRNGSLKRLNWSGSHFPIYAQLLIHKDKNKSTIINEFINTVMKTNSL